MDNDIKSLLSPIRKNGAGPNPTDDRGTTYSGECRSQRDQKTDEYYNPFLDQLVKEIEHETQELRSLGKLVSFEKNYRRRSIHETLAAIRWGDLLVEPAPYASDGDAVALAVYLHGGRLISTQTIDDPVVIAIDTILSSEYGMQLVSLYVAA